MADGALLTGGQAVFGASGFLGGNFHNSVIQLGSHSLGLDDLAAVAALQAHAQASGGAGSGNLIDRHEILVFAVSLLDRLLQDRAADRALLAGGHGIGLGDLNGSVLAGGGNLLGDHGAALGALVGNLTFIDASRILGDNSVLIQQGMCQLLSHFILDITAVHAGKLVNAGLVARGGSQGIGLTVGVVVRVGGIAGDGFLVVAAFPGAGDQGVTVSLAGSGMDVLLQVVAQSLLHTRKSLSLGLGAQSALILQVLALRAGCRNELCFHTPLVLASSLDDLLVSYGATAALQSVQAIFLTGNSLVFGVGLVKPHVVAQSSTIGLALALDLSVADGAQGDYLASLGAGRLNDLEVVFVIFVSGVFTGGVQDLVHFGQSLAAARALVGDLTSRAAGGFYTGGLYGDVVIGNDFIAQECVAILALQSDDAGLAAALGGSQFLGNHRRVSIFVNRGLLLGNQDLMANCTFGTLGQAGGGACSVNLRHNLGGMALGRFGSSPGVLLKVFRTALQAGVGSATGGGAGSGLVHAIVPLVLTGSRINLGLAVAAGGANLDDQAILFTGDLLVLGIFGLLHILVAQCALGDFLGLADLTADGALVGDLLVLGAGGLGHGDHVFGFSDNGVLAGGVQDLVHVGQGLSAARALVGNLAVLAAGGLHTGCLHGNMLSGDDFVAQVLVAQLAFHSGDTGLAAADGGSQLLGNHSLVSILVNRNFHPGNQNFMADLALGALGQTGGSAGGVNTGDHLGGVLFLGLGQLALELLDIGVAAVVFADKLFTGGMLAIRFLQSGRNPLVTQSRNFLGLGLVAAGALGSLHSGLFTSSSLGVSSVDLHVVAQSSTGNLFNLTGLAADGAFLANLFVLGAGGGNDLVLNKGVLTSGGDDLALQGLAADGALVGDLALVLAGGSLAVGLVLFLHMLGRNDPVAAALSADGAGVAADAVSAGLAVSLSQLTDQDHVVLPGGIGEVGLLGVVTAGALLQGVAAILTGGIDYGLLDVMTQSGIFVNIPGLTAALFLAVAVGADVGLVTGVLTVGGHIGIVNNDPLFLGSVTGGGDFTLHVLVTVGAVRRLYASHCTGCFFYRLPMGIRMLTIRRDIHFGSEGGSGQHGDHHHQRQKSSKDFPLHEITSIEI